MRAFDNIDTALQAIKQGRFIVVVDDVDRENEGDLLMAAEKVTPDSIPRLITHHSSLLLTHRLRFTYREHIPPD